MPAPPSPASSMWLDAPPLRELLALESRWLATRREAIAAGARVWLSPALVGASDDVVRLALGPGGRLHGSLSADAAHLPFADGSVRSLVLQHVLDQPVPAALFGECVRVLATQGELVVFGLNPWSAWRPWLTLQPGRSRAKARTRMVGRLRALFVQLGLGFHELRWLGPRYPSSDAGELPEPAARIDLLRASYALTLRKPHDTVIALFARERAAVVPMTPRLVPAPRVSARVSARAGQA